jgi:D-alanyl-lipoteichoic acid acyltransferase DltB (MBOAT superfamily)
MIARGIGRLMGFELPENFRAPYIARGFSDFWGRWHISLSRWLRDYVYIPMGGNRGGPWKTYRNLMVTMLACGLWHDANWTFLVWGGLHGLYLVVERMLKRLTSVRDVLESNGFIVSVAGIIVVFHLVTFAWIFFWAKSVGQALTILLAMADVKGLASFQMPSKLILKDIVWLVPVGAYYAWQYLEERRDRPIAVPEWLTMCGLAILAFITIVCRQASDAFIYFQY